MLSSIIATVVGGALALLGMWFKQVLDQRRDSRLREQEARAVMAALYGEVRLFWRELETLGGRVSGTFKRMALSDVTFDEHFLEVARLSEPLLYKSLAPKIGMLPPDLVLAITEFHANLEACRQWTPRLVDNKERKFSYSVLHVLVPIRDAVRNITPAVRKIEAILNITIPAQIPDLSSVEGVIEFEKVQYE